MSRPPSGQATRTGQAEVHAEALHELLVARPGAGQDHLAHRLCLGLGHVVVDREAHLVGQARAGVRLVPDRRERPGEEAGRSDGDRKIGHSGEVAEHAGRLVGAVAAADERAHEGEGVEVDALGLEPGALHGLEQRLDHRAASRHEHDLHPRRAVGRLGEPGHLVVEDRLVQGHGDGLGGLEPHGGLALLLVLDARQLDHPDDDLLVGHAEAHVLGEVLIRHEALERVRTARPCRSPRRR